MNQELAAFVLHALEPREEYAVREHLVQCDACLEEVTGLASTASLLTLVRPEDAAPLPDATAPAAPRWAVPPAPAAPPPARSAPPSGRRERRGPGSLGRTRRRAVLAAAAAVLVGSAAIPTLHALTGHGGLDGPGRPAAAVVLHGTGPGGATHAEVSMAAVDAGTRLHLALAGAPTHGWCALVARGTDGRSEIAAAWPADGHRRVDVSGTTAIPAAQLSELSVVTDTGRGLVTIPVPHQNS